MRATLEPWHGWNNNLTFRLYFGATPANPVVGMYSFVPCQPAAGTRSGFPRPIIELQDLINPTRCRQAGSGKPQQLSALPAHWQNVTGQVLDAGLALATRLDLPDPSVSKPHGTLYPEAGELQ